MLIVTIDTGTTNTRVRTWKAGNIISEATSSIGIRDCAKSGNVSVLITAIKQLVEQVLTVFTLQEQQQCYFIASGMITSEFGLCHLPHLTAPVSFKQLVEQTQPRVIEEITAQPIYFIPGIKNAVSKNNIDTIEHFDVMRGEEVEVFGLLSQLPEQLGEALVILPGSHSKFVHLDNNKYITATATTMAGEILDTLTSQTILSGSLRHQFVKNLDEEYLLKGAELCQRVGIARSCFSVRLLDLFTQSNIDQKASFLLGIVLYSDLLAIKNSQALNFHPTTRIVISGKETLANSLALLIKNDPYFMMEPMIVEENSQQPLSGLGAIAILRAIVAHTKADSNCR